MNKMPMLRREGGVGALLTSQAVAPGGIHRKSICYSSTAASLLLSVS